MPERTLVGFIHNPSVTEAPALVDSLIKSLKLEDTSWVCPSSNIDTGVTEQTLADTLVIFTVGGDGTILSAVRIAAPHSVPIVGINMGRVGFMTELTRDEAVERAPEYVDGSHRIEKRMMLRATVEGGAGESRRLTLDALNDIVVSRAEARLLDVHVKVDGADLYTYRADGLIAATATGSTGYALSAGGPIVYPEAKVMQIQPLAAHLSFQTGVIVSGDSTIELTIGEHEAILTVDGFADTTLGPDDRLVVKRSPHVARFLRAAPLGDFFASLTARLGIGPRPLPPN